MIRSIVARLAGTLGPSTGWVLVTLLLIAAYAVVFVVTAHHVPVENAMIWAVCNAVPHVMLAIPLVDRVGPRLARLDAHRAVGLAVVAAPAYAVTAYCSTIFLLALTTRIQTDGLWVQFFQGPAVVWQCFQTLAYALLALTTGMLLDARRELQLRGSAKAPAPQPQHWLVRTPDGIGAIDPREVIRMQAEGDYVRIVLAQRTLLSRIGLGECAERVSALPFLRVHRSHLVNSDAIVRAEPAGNGRIVLQLRNGDQVTSSREGARLVRRSSL